MAALLLELVDADLDDEPLYEKCPFTRTLKDLRPRYYLDRFLRITAALLFWDARMLKREKDVQCYEYKKQR